MHIKALLLDFGSVISTSLFERHQLIEEQLGLKPNCLSWKGPFDPESDTIWIDMLNEKITERDYWAIRAKEIGELSGHSNWKVVDLLKAIVPEESARVLRPEAVKTIYACINNNIKVGVLSNEVELFNGKDWVDNLSFRNKLDCWVDSTHTKMLKPDARSYQFAIDELNVEPYEILFVDDQIRNIAGAVKSGLRVVHFDIVYASLCWNYINEILRLKNSF